MMESKKMTSDKNAVFLGIDEKNEKYLVQLFALFKKRENVIIADQKTHFNNTELGMIFEILTAKYENRKVISTQLAKMLGVTRSAISQSVNKLEARGIIKRIPAKDDKKIAYIEVADGLAELYREDLEKILRFVGVIVDEFGEEKFNTLCNLFDEFNQLTKNKVKRAKKTSEEKK